MIKFVLSLTAAAALAAPLLADPSGQPISFSRDGVSYVGTVTERDGAQIISGHEVASGNAFRLVVKNGWVNGTYGERMISYRAPAAAPIETASR